MTDTWLKKGQKFGYLTIIDDPFMKRAANGQKRRMVSCQCECGKIKIIAACSLYLTLNSESKGTKSCGCKPRKSPVKIPKIKPIKIDKRIKHRESNTKLFRLWNGVLNRCFNPRHTRYHCYGGKNITVCEERREFLGFKEWALNHGYKEGLSIHRINSDLNYCPENCVWITISENSKALHIERKNKLLLLTEENNVLINKIELFAAIFKLISTQKLICI